VERTLGTEGLVNINTAPLEVLEQLPMIINPATGWANRPADKAANVELAKAIVEYRRTRPFTS
jgi:DNA uptake protein ComE-like DNA-binding protein